MIVDWALKGMKEKEDELAVLLQHIILRTEELGYEIYMYRKKEGQK